MGCWDVCCIICGNRCWSDGKDKTLKWMEQCMLLLADNTIIKNCREDSCNTTFAKYPVDPKDDRAYTAQPINRLFGYFEPIYFTNKGIFIHKPCYQFVEKELGIKLKYGDFPVRISLKNTNKYIPLHVDIDYKPISNYLHQFMEYDKMEEDGNKYMATNPLNGDVKNIRRIKRILSLLKLKKEKRTGPTASATFYKEGDIKLGNDNNFWIKRNGKWSIIKDEIVVRTYVFKKNYKHQKYINSIPQLGEFNDKLLFVKQFSIKNKQSTIEFIGTNETIARLEKYIN